MTPPTHQRCTRGAPLGDVNNWHSISKLKIYKPVIKKDNTIPNYHWKSIQNLFNKWSDDNIFKNAFENYINKKNNTANIYDILSKFNT